jgi:hypothetical protein
MDIFEKATVRFIDVDGIAIGHPIHHPVTHFDILPLEVIGGIVLEG